jgi:hypothetical protein
MLESGPILAAFCIDDFARAAEERDLSPEDDQWMEAAAGRGEVDLQKVPRVQMHRADVPWDSCDDVEVHVLLRAAGGANVAEIVRGSPYSPVECARALGRLGRRALVRLVERVG